MDMSRRKSVSHYTCRCRLDKSRTLLGYPNALKPEEYVKPDSGVIDLIIQANSNPELPHFLILDEMNLSHVERYFADFLSVMESNEEIPLYAEGTVDNGCSFKT